MSDTFVGEDHWSWKGGKPELTCMWCGEEYEEYRENRSTFCSKDCLYKWRSAEVRGRDHPQWNGGQVEGICEMCGDGFMCDPSEFEQRRFCSRECFQTWRCETFSGEGHPLWQGGEYAYGIGWNESKKELIRERDGRKCRICGKSELQHIDEYGKKHTVHHIVRARELEDVSGDVRNAPLNLVTVCCSHNNAVLEAIPSWVQFMAFLPHPPLPTEQATFNEFATDD